MTDAPLTEDPATKEEIADTLADTLRQDTETDASSMPPLCGTPRTMSDNQDDAKETQLDKSESEDDEDLDGEALDDEGENSDKENDGPNKKGGGKGRGGNKCKGKGGGKGRGGGVKKVGKKSTSAGTNASTSSSSAGSSCGSATVINKKAIVVLSKRQQKVEDIVAVPEVKGAC